MKNLMPIYLSSAMLVICVIGAFWIPHHVKTTSELPYTPEEASEIFEKYFENVGETASASDIQQLRSFVGKYERVLFSSEEAKESIEELYFSFAFVLAVVVLMHLSLILKYVRKRSL
jgi:hypothetical protein